MSSSRGVRLVRRAAHACTERAPPLLGACVSAVASARPCRAARTPTPREAPRGARRWCAARARDGPARARRRRRPRAAPRRSTTWPTARIGGATTERATRSWRALVHAGGPRGARRSRDVSGASRRRPGGDERRRVDRAARAADRRGGGLRVACPVASRVWPRAVHVRVRAAAGLRSAWCFYRIGDMCPRV